MCTCVCVCARSSLMCSGICNPHLLGAHASRSLVLTSLYGTHAQTTGALTAEQVVETAMDVLLGKITDVQTQLVLLGQQEQQKAAAAGMMQQG